MPHPDPTYCITETGEYSVGTYRVTKKNQIEVTELPKGFWTNDFITKMRDKPLVKDVVDKSGAIAL